MEQRREKGLILLGGGTSEVSSDWLWSVPSGMGPQPPPGDTLYRLPLFRQHRPLPSHVWRTSQGKPSRDSRCKAPPCKLPIWHPSCPGGTREPPPAPHLAAVGRETLREKRCFLGVVTQQDLRQVHHSLSGRQGLGPQSQAWAADLGGLEGGTCGAGV